MLTPEDKQHILGEFPDIKLSYETFTHKKVYNSNFILAIPDGIKCFAWFTLFNDKPVCILFELENNRNKEIKNVRIINTCFSKSLCYGTIFYGTIFYHSKNNFFSIEDIFSYKGKDISRENWTNKFNKIIDVLNSDIKQISYNKHFIVFGLPIIAYSNENLDSLLKDIKYKISCIQYYQYNKSNSHISLSIDNFNSHKDIPLLNSHKEIPKQIIFQVKPDIQNDVYNLFDFSNEFYGTANIPDYKTSIMMNKLFRNIKENNNLDKLEESDDEDEFENSNVDKYVYLDRIYKMKCHYNKKFQKWTPIEMVDNTIKVSNKNEITNFVNKLYEGKRNTSKFVRHLHNNYI